MPTANLNRSAFLLLTAFIIQLLGPGDANAALLSRAGGQAYYDNVADLTWAMVASQSTSSGATTGLDWFPNHQSWIGAHLIDGIGGWRMPRADANGDGIVLASCDEHLVCRDNEMGYLHAAHGVTQIAPLPFDLNGAAIFLSSTVSSGSIYHEFNFATGENSLRNISSNRGFAMLVQSGDVLGTPGSEGSDLITNGSFENGVAIAPAAFISSVSAGSGSIADWNITSGNIDYIESLWQASDGTRSLDMSGGNWGTVSQTIQTVPGHRYRVRFDLAGNPSGGPTQKSLRVTAADEQQMYDFDSSGRSTNDMGWTAHTFEFTAKDATTNIYFVSLINGSFGPALDNVRAFDLGPPPSEPANGASLEIQSAYQFELLYRDAGSGSSRDGAFHRPLPAAGFYAIAHQGQAHYGVPGEDDRPGAAVMVARALEPDALAAPTGFELVWEDSASGAALDGAAWRPLPPTNLPNDYRCLGHFFTRGRTAPDLSSDPVTQRALAQYRCVREDLTAPGVVGTRIWEDKGSGANLDFSAWRIEAADNTGLAVGGFVGEPSYDPPTETVYVLDEAATRPAPTPDLSAGPYLELKMMRDLQVSGDCDWDLAIYNDSGTGATFSNVSWWHPQDIPAGFHQLGHTYERFHNPACPLDPLIVARELAPGALAAPVGWDAIPWTPNVDPIWTDQGSEGGNNGAIWKPTPPPGYVCLGSFATGGYGYAPPDSPIYMNSGSPIDQQIAQAAQNFRCVREDLVVPARIGKLGWYDVDSGASLGLSMWEIEPAERLGEDAGIDVGHFWGVRNSYFMPLELLYTINTRAVADVDELTQIEFDALIAKGPILQLHPNERYWPDDPVYSLDNDASLCWSTIPDDENYYGLPSPKRMGQSCDVFVSDSFGIPDGIGFNGCEDFDPISHPNAPAGAGNVPFYSSAVQCLPAASVTAGNLYGHTIGLQSSPVAQDPHFKMWLEIDTGPTQPPYLLPENPTGDVDRTRSVVRVRPWNGIGHEVQYWIWYPYNGPGKYEAGCGAIDTLHETPTTGRHQGDWEVIALRYDDLGRLAELYMSAHSGENVVPVKQTATSLTGGIDAVGLQPIVYSARDSHANYPTTGNLTYAEPYSLDLGPVLCTLYVRLKDLTATGPPAATQIDFSDPNRLIVASSDFPEIAKATPLPYWLDFPGRWGGYEAVEFLGEIEFSSIVLYDQGFQEVSKGPQGPPTKPIWQGQAVPEPTGGVTLGILLLAGLAAWRDNRGRPTFKR